MSACIRPASPEDLPQVLQLNLQSERFLSPLDARRLAALHGMAAWHHVVADAGVVAAFLLAFREGAAYDSPNYRWFAERHGRFLYIDRVVVDERCQGRGLGRALYERLFAHAREGGVPLVTCEFDLDPPNPASARFHAGFGFREVGRQQYGALRKTVSLQAASTAPGDETV